MIDFQPIQLNTKDAYTKFLWRSSPRGCEYGFSNLFLWGRQRFAFVGQSVVFFSQFNRRSVYPFPLGEDLREAIGAVMHDAACRGIPCRLTGLTQADCDRLEALFPGKFRYHVDRDGFDYVYRIEDLCELPGRKFQKKRNHLNRFRSTYPNHSFVPITEETLPVVEVLAQQWFSQRLEADPQQDFLMEQAAFQKALHNYTALGMEGLLLYVDGQPVAFTIGSLLYPDVFDVHFEKALDGFDGAYNAINQGFARYLQEKYPALGWLDREDDMGLEGLRKAKLSYCPDYMVEKHWACLLEDGYEY